MVKNVLFLMTLILGIILPTVAQKIPAYVPTNGLVGWWPFNGNANDESGNNNNGTVNGATLTTDRIGIANSAYSFDGIDDYIEIKNDKNLNPTSISICGWIKNELDADLGYGGEKSILTKWYQDYNCNNNSDNYMLILSKSSNISELFGATSLNRYSTNAILSKTNIIGIGSWKFFVFIHDEKDGQKLFVDNKLISENKTIGTLCGSTNDLYFGADNKAGKLWRFLKGQLDDIAIYNRALTQEEITNLYKGCSKETAMSSSFNSVVYTTNGSVNLSANPTGGIFKGDAVTNNAFDPTKGKLGKNQVKYNFKNSSGCSDSTNFTMILVDTVGNKCSTYDTLKIKVKLTTGINKDQYTNLTVYPNPTSDILVIVTPDEKILSGYKYRILDIQGKEVYNTSISTAKTEIDINKLGSKGVYILHIVDANGTSIENKKIVLE